MKRLLKRFGWLALAGFFLLAAYESYAVVKARQRTPELFGRVLADKTALPITGIPRERIRQLLLIEDPDFYQHKGFDLSTPGAGMTTITQAMVKYLYFDDFKPGFMKIEQTLIAWLAVNPLIGKDEQLTVFINTAYFGTDGDRQVRGFPQAAQAYFGKPFAELTEDEYLSLVAMLIGPNRFSVKYHPEVNRERVKRIRKVLSGEYQPQGLRDVYYGQ